MIEQLLVEETASRSILNQHFPMLTQFGIPDADVLIHSHLLSYLAVWGAMTGFSGIIECPIVIQATSKLTHLGEVRSDCIWFVANGTRPLVAFEVERFEAGDEGKLRHKVENLAIASLRAQDSLDATVLIYWLRSGAFPRGMENAIGPYQRGFTRNGIAVPPPKSPLFLIKTVFKKKAGLLTVSDVLFVGASSSVSTK